MSIRNFPSTLQWENHLTYEKQTSTKKFQLEIKHETLGNWNANNNIL